MIPKRRGEWGSFCADTVGHLYSHYDESADRSWQDDWREEIPLEGGGYYIDCEVDE